VPKEWEAVDVRRKVIEWLTQSVRPWLLPAVHQLPAGISLVDNPGPAGQNLVVNLHDIGNEDLERLVAQLTWTLYPEVQNLMTGRDSSPILLKVDSTEKKTKGRFLDANIIAARPNQDEPRRFAIVDRHVRRLQGSSRDETPPPLLDVNTENKEVDNKDVEWAAYSRERGSTKADVVALARRQRNGRLKLFLGPKNKQSTEIVGVQNLSAITMLQPEFADSENLVVVADGVLHLVRRSNATAQAVPNINGVKAFSVAPEGRRIAFIKGDRLYLAAFSASKGMLTGVPGQILQIPMILTGLTGVAFTAEDWLAVSGSYAGVPRVVEISLDGGLVGSASPTDPWLWVGTPGDKITSLTAYPDGPNEPVHTKRVYATVNNEARDLTSSGNPLTGEVAGAAVPAGTYAVNPFFLQ
jgi:hypothetical protein